MFLTIRNALDVFIRRTSVQLFGGYAVRWRLFIAVEGSHHGVEGIACSKAEVIQLCVEIANSATDR